MFDDRDYRIKLKLYPAGGFQNIQIAIQLETTFKLNYRNYSADT